MTVKPLCTILTPREMECARMVADCLMNEDIARAMGLKRHYVAQLLHRVYEKVGYAGEGYLKARLMLALRFDREFRDSERHNAVLGVTVSAVM